MMDVLQMNSIATSGAAAAGTVATALSPRHAAVQAKDTTSSTSGTTTGGTSAAAAANPSNITSNDFLTLLVSELKNQDPTQPTDPNAYISQLVGVNSLQQLISINQGLTSIEASPTAAPTTDAVSGASST